MELKNTNLQNYMVTNLERTKSESYKQKIMRKMYPIIRKVGEHSSNGTVLINESNQKPATSIYDLEVNLNSGKSLNLADFKGKKIVLVNTASECGYTGQYAELQNLQEKLNETVQIIGFPANDFGNQEKGSDTDISQFCKVNYGVTFPIARKGVVVKKESQQPVFTWLTDKQRNGWNDHQPDWNFGKYIVDEVGILTHYFGPAVSPLDDEFKKAL